MANEPKPIWTATELAGAGFRFLHPLDDDAEADIVPLSRITGLQRTGVNLVRVPPGKRAFPVHRHHAEEEWVYILSGTAEVRLDDEAHRLDAGCFAAFSPGGPAHAVDNASPDAELAYLTGGESARTEIVDFPAAGRRLVRSGGMVGAAAEGAFEPFDFFSRSPDGAP